MCELVFENGPAAAEQMIPIHNNASYVDDRYLITEDERQHIVETFFSSIQPLILKSFSPKEKKKVVILGKMAELFYDKLMPVLGFHLEDKVSAVIVDELFLRIKEIGANIVYAPRIPEEHGPYYYAMFFKDLEGIKYEIVYNRPEGEEV